MFNSKHRNEMLAAMAIVLAASFASAQAGPGPTRQQLSNYTKPVDYPNANEAAVAAHFNRARRIAGDDLYTFFDTLCIQDQVYTQRTFGAQYEGFIPAQKVFDNLYYIGQMSVAAWAIKTSAGIILIDSLNNADEARNIMIPGLISLGMDPKQIKYLIITHSHGDHFGGAQYFKDTYGAKLVASAADWDAMEKMTPASIRPQVDAPPKRGASDITIGDGQSLSLGDEEIHFVLTPAHSPGTLSLYFRATENGTAHIAGLYGGLGMPKTDDLKRMQVASMTHWMDVSKAAAVDAEIGNHPLHFNGPARLEILKYREAGQQNPFVLGVANYQRFIDLQRECVRLSLARDGVAE
jgi:metallo-beta-lactamase class B